MSGPRVTELVGRIPYRAALAGGWIDQPFVSRLNPEPPGSMVVVNLEPDVRFMDRAGMATGTRKVAMRMWGGGVPPGDPGALVRRLYEEENRGIKEPSGSQDMIGLLYPGINRLDYDFGHEGGYFPKHVETCTDVGVARWLESVLNVIPVAPRPPGYGPLGEKRLDAEWVRRLGQSGKDCYAAILSKDARALGSALNECMVCWEALLPHTVRHSTLELDILALMRLYQRTYAGAMYSGCGGGYLFVISGDDVPGAFKVRVRVAPAHELR